jgi:hypothetical protein
MELPITNYKFNNMSNLSYDKENTVDSINNGINSYMLNNYMKNDTNNYVNLAVSQPGINFQNNNNNVNRNNINLSKTFSNKDINEVKKNTFTPQGREYKTLPYLGKGPGDVDIETGLRHGKMVDTKSIPYKQTSSEHSYLPYVLTPLLKEVRDDIIPGGEVYSQSHINGGIATRETYRDV